ncbi:TOBE domain-containing protein [Cupriavidus plantarum]|uniref:TOBE domain-containing protein n=1 Tax=Cupriavidus plantarum TaxID=942865 RepID=UPI001B175327|nr:TOBE domain-containing protein [Cupriavidus plantarum]CAG2127453.1 Molybdenum-pterin-binding protein MopA [Cupriavidus plantarum]SMR67368.1 molybdate transport system regulatory protein [Cupriavidus plantarum]
MLELEGAIWFRAGAREWGGKDRIALLAAIGEHGSITAAARAVGLSYKAAWDAIDAMNNSAGEALVARAAGGKGGGGTQLTERAQQLIRTYRTLEAEHRRFVAWLGTQANAATAGGGASTSSDIASNLSSDLPSDLATDLGLMRRFTVRTSARNKLFGRVEAVRRGAVNDEVTLRLPGGQRIVATITRESTETLELAPGVEAFALIKASSVLIGAEDVGGQLSASNQLPGHVARVVDGAVNAEIVLQLDGGGTIAAIVPHTAIADLSLVEGTRAIAIFKASSVIVGTL